MDQTSLTNEVCRAFRDDAINVNVAKKRIEVYWLADAFGQAWVPLGGRVLHNEAAKQHVRWLARYVNRFRSLLPVDLQCWPIVIGEQRQGEVEPHSRLIQGSPLL